MEGRRTEKFSHRTIYDAIAAGEEGEAASLMEMHLREAQRYILKTISAISKEAGSYHTLEKTYLSAMDLPMSLVTGLQRSANVIFFVRLHGLPQRTGEAFADDSREIGAGTAETTIATTRSGRGPKASSASFYAYD